MSKIRQIAGAVCESFDAFQKWWEANKSRGAAGLSGWMLMLFAFGTGSISSVCSLTLTQIFPQYKALIDCWPMMPFKIKVATLLVTTMLLAWSAFAFYFGLMFAFYSRECMRRLEDKPSVGKSDSAASRAVGIIRSGSFL